MTEQQAPALSAALEAEHRQIDAGLSEFRAGLDAGDVRPAPLAAAAAALRRHIYLEEERVFPGLSAGGLVAPVAVMLREHGKIWEALDGVEALAAAGDVAASRGALDGLNTLLEAHNLKEERIIYPAADGALTGPAADRLHEDLARATLPPGWRCRALAR